MSGFQVNLATDLVGSFGGQQFCVKHIYVAWAPVPQHQLLLLTLQGSEWDASAIIVTDIEPAALAGGPGLYISQQLPAINAALQAYFGAAAPSPSPSPSPAPAPDAYSALDAAFLAQYTYVIGSNGVPQLQLKP